MSATYQAEAHNHAQKNCPHRLVTKTTRECCTCGSRKTAEGKWEYLTPEWHRYYQSGADRPEPYIYENTR